MLFFFYHEVVGATNHNRSCIAFRRCVDSCDLADAGFQGLPFT